MHQFKAVLLQSVSCFPRPPTQLLSVLLFKGFFPTILPLSSLPPLPTDTQANQMGMFCPIGSLHHGHMPVEDRPSPPVLLMQGKP